MDDNSKKFLIKATRVLPLLLMVYLLRFETYLYYPRSDFRISYEIVAGTYIVLYFILYVIWPVPEEDRETLTEVFYNLILVEYALLNIFSQYHMYFTAGILLLLCAAVTWLDEKVELLAIRSGCASEKINKIRYKVRLAVICVGMMIPAIFSLARYKMQAPEYSENSKYAAEQKMELPVNYENTEIETKSGGLRCVYSTE